MYQGVGVGRATSAGQLSCNLGKVLLRVTPAYSIDGQLQFINPATGAMTQLNISNIDVENGTLRIRFTESTLGGMTGFIVATSNRILRLDARL